jgi:hypothetical protein
MKCGAGEEWEISWTDRAKNEKVLHGVQEKRKANCIGHILRRECLLNLLLKERWKEREDEEVSIYWMTLRKREGTGGCKRKH